MRALQYRAKEVDLELPVIASILGSNRLQIEHALEMVTRTGKKRVGLLGFSFKAGTDDLRESPIVILAEALLGKGYDLRIYDRNVSLARLVGANKDYIEHQIPHLSSLLQDVDRRRARTLRRHRRRQCRTRIRGGAVADATGAGRHRPRPAAAADHGRAEYEGICWCLRSRALSAQAA